MRRTHFAPWPPPRSLRYAFGVYVLRGGRLTVYDTNLRELRNTPITQTLTADAKVRDLRLTDQRLGTARSVSVPGPRQGIPLPVQTTVGFVQPVQGLSRASGAMQGSYGGATAGPTSTWNSSVSGTETPYMTERRMYPTVTGTPRAGTALSSGGTMTGAGVRTTPSTTGTARATPYAAPNTSGAVGTVAGASPRAAPSAAPIPEPALVGTRRTYLAAERAGARSSPAATAPWMATL